MPKRIINCRILPLLALLVLTASSRSFASQRDELPRGQVIESVACKADPQQTYALYLPSGYSREKKWPILYAWDAGARGKLPVTLFKDAAEKFGFIVVGSNNSRNGIQVSPIVQAVLEDTNGRFAIDPKRVYSAGFSGGARLAFALAGSNPGGVAGVIACSGGFPSTAAPAPDLKFVVFATTGTEDFNFPEMQQLKRKMDEAGMQNRLAVFAGGHDWPPASLATQAIAWLELQAMKRGSRVKDEALIDQMLAERLAVARGFETSAQNYAAYLEYQSLAADFGGLREVKDIVANAERLAATKEVKAGIRNAKNEEDRQGELEAKIQTLIAQLADTSQSVETMAELKRIISDLQRKSEDAKDAGQQRVARRVLEAVFVQAYEEANNLYLQKNYAGVPGKLEIAALLKPKSPRLFYELALAHARAGNKSKAINALGRAIENGFTDVAKIEQDPDFETLRNESGYKKLVSELKKSM
ncbi:MAG TPA: dienelactone hydrolase family protein [Pyrinomonadaceae bacterium]|nr:dienelactone hydrolase family protein [Pyrinomonadaceae bacterium]